MSNVNGCNDRPTVEYGTFHTSRGDASYCIPSQPAKLVRELKEGVLYTQVSGFNGQIMNEFSTSIDCNLSGNCCVTVECPASNSYTMVARYIQRNTANCSSGSSQCNWNINSDANESYPIGFHRQNNCDTWNVAIDQATGLGTCYLI